MADWFPIMGDKGRGKWFIPWSVIEPHEQQARLNHQQTLAELAQRGGLDPTEAIAVLKNRGFRAIEFVGNYDEDAKMLAAIVTDRIDAAAYQRGYDDGCETRQADETHG